MGIEINLSDPNNASSPTSLEGTLADNNRTIETALARALSRDNLDGDNFMLADLDLNGFRLINSAPAMSESDLVTRGGVSAIQAGEFRKNVLTGDLEYRSGGTLEYTVLFTREELQGPPGEDGDGVGDLRAAQNLSDVDNVATARSNLGLVPGVNVQPYNAELNTISDKAESDDPRFDRYIVQSVSSNTTNVTTSSLYNFTAGATLTLNSRPSGTVLTVYVGSGSVTVARGTGVSLAVSGSTANTNVTISAGGFATIVCLTGNNFVISGSNVSAV